MGNLQVLDNELMPVVKIMQGDEVICPGVIIHQYFILAAAHCVQKMTGLYIYGRQNMSIYQVYIFNHQSSHPLALIQTLTKMSQPNVCFDDQDEASSEIIVGYRKKSSREDPLVFTNVT